MTAGVTSALASGAIAVNDGMGTAAEEAGNDECKVAVSFEQCGAYVGAGFGDTKEATEKMALEKCPNCKIIVSERR